MSRQQTMFFYDYETWGVSPSRDRACQFAGIRTDLEFNVLGEPLVIYCQPPDDYFPSAGAALVTRIKPQTCVEQGLREVDFIKAIHSEMSVPGTVTLGYNTINFDDEVTRHTSYRNFLDPYSWAWKNGNSRWDLLNVMRACGVLRPDGLEWPLNSDGKRSYKLEHLSVANGIEHINAHDAESDVYASIELGKKLSLAQPKMFSYLFKNRNKKELSALVSIHPPKPLVHIESVYGGDNKYLSIILPVAHHPTNKNSILAIDLGRDVGPLMDLDADSLRERLYTRRSELAEGELPAPLIEVQLNKCPILAPMGVLTADDVKRIDIDMEGIGKRQRVVTASLDGVRAKVIEVYSKPKEYDPITDVDLMLYEGFFSNSDRKLMDVIPDLNGQEVGEYEPGFTDERIPELKFRFKARNYPESLTEDERERWAKHCKDALNEKRIEHFEELDRLTEENKDDPEKLDIINAVRQYSEGLVLKWCIGQD
ncbi:exodeoxyribonuclease I [Vibrio barjaei]|uniref:exodeoxyribonuclease I n=1 Tax=Vibrio barjaei TaxID=1676683 RepID=UPI0022840738|nr:exodeoxyribonuclease I [Vibrio barjaei]MCY9874515.1 exodeoxyribonuclease I [Vibrio barjaei]